MSITDELREWVKSLCVSMSIQQIHRNLLAIADRIDAEHERVCAEAWDNGYESDYLGIERWLTEHPQVMERHGWVRLPMDADGEFIHVGDVMAYADNTKPMKVVALVPPAVFLTDDGPRFADLYRHYKPPTVEDVLTEMITKLIERNELTNGAEQTVAEYAAKLREMLKGDAE